VPELDDINVERICSTFHVFSPLLGYMKDSGGYNALFALERHWWTSTLIPYYKRLAGRLKTGLVPEFPRYSDIAFDMSDVWALREDMDALATRFGKLAQIGIISVEEVREKVGFPAKWDADATFLIPSATPAIKGDDLEQIEQPAAVPALPAPRNRGRPKVTEDDAAKATYAELARLRDEHPGITYRQASMFLAVSERTLQRYDQAFRN
jgi:hypothetical protein